MIDRTQEVNEGIPILEEIVGKLRIPALAWCSNYWSGQAPAAIEHFRNFWDDART